MEVSGTVKQVLPVEEFTGKSGKHFRKQTAVVSFESGKYTNDLAFDMWGDKIRDLRPGQSVFVKLNIKSRQGEGKHAGRWFTDVNAWSVDILDGGEPTAQPAAAPAAAPAGTHDWSNEDDGLPFAPLRLTAPLFQGW